MNTPAHPRSWFSFRHVIALVTLAFSTLQCGSNQPSGLIPVSARGAQLALSPSNSQIAQGSAQQFSLRSLGADGRVRDVTPQVKWTLSSADGRHLGSPTDGLVFLADPGRYLLTAEFDGGRVETPITATTAAIRSVTLSPMLPRVPKGAAQQFKATALLTDGTTQDVTDVSGWSVKDTEGSSIATVSSRGLATAKNVGKSRVAARYSLITGATVMEVTPAALKSLTIAPLDPTLPKGTSLSFSATGLFTDGTTQDVTVAADWTVKDIMGTGVASIDGTGTVLAEAMGQAEVSVEYMGQVASTTLNVTAASVVSLTVSPTAAVLAKGTTQQFTATARFSDGSSQDVTATAAWLAVDVSGSGVAAIGATGLAKANAVGTALVGCGYRGLSSSATLEVKPAVLTSVAMTPTMATVSKGRTQSFQLMGTYSDGSMQDVSSSTVWTTADVTGLNVASINSSGQALAKNEGQAQIRGEHMGRSATATLTVTPATLTSMDATPSKGSTAVGATQQFTATAYYSDGSSKDVTSLTTWSTSDASVASVSTGGLVTGKAAGRCNVVAIYNTNIVVRNFAVVSARGNCSADGWCWRNPLPQGDKLSSVWAADANNVWAVGDTGRIMKWNGTAWSPQPSGTTQTLDSVWGSDADNVWAVGAKGTVLKWNGTAWTPQLSGTTSRLNEVWGTSASSVWIVGEAGTILRWNGTTWSRQTSGTTEYLESVWGSDANNVWTVGNSGAIVKWNGTTWSVQPSGTSEFLQGVWGADANNVWAVGLKGIILKWNGTSWSPQTSGVTNWLRAVWGTDARSIWAAGDDGTILRWDGTSWARQTIGTTAGFNAVRGSDGSNVWAVGYDGVIVKWNGTAWSSQSSGSTAVLSAVWGADASNVWAVGSGGTILKWNGTAWTRQTSGTTQDLVGVWGFSSSIIWAVGGPDTVLAGNGTSWLRVVTPTVGWRLQAVWGLDRDNMWAVGTNGTILKAWNPQPSGTTANLAAVWGSDPNNVWVVGERGTILKWNGTTWNAQASGTTSPLTGVWGSDANHVWAVGLSGIILKWDGTAWAVDSGGPTPPLTRVWGTSASNVWAVGFLGAMKRWDGTRWTSQSTGSGRHIFGLWGTSAPNVWAVGDGGSILEYGP